MAIIYLTEQGSRLCKRSRRLVIEKEKEILLQIPDFKVDRVLVFGNVQITTQAMAFLLDNGIEVSFMSFYGKYRGRLTPLPTLLQKATNGTWKIEILPCQKLISV